MRSISRHITPLVFNSLGADTHAYRRPHRNNFKKPGAGRRAPGLKILARFGYFLQNGFYWERQQNLTGSNMTGNYQPSKYLKIVCHLSELNSIKNYSTTIDFFRLFLLLWIITSKIVLTGVWNIAVPIIYTLQPSTPYSLLLFLIINY